MKYRYEKFGGIVTSDDPPLMAFVDKKFMLDLGLKESPLWKENPEGPLTAPLEVHFALADECPVGCSHCFKTTDKGEKKYIETDRAKDVLKRLCDMGVFHIAFGGGEPLFREDLVELAEYTRSLGITPTLTTSGESMTREKAEKLKVFGRVNVSMDGVGDNFAIFRDKAFFPKADAALRMLIEQDIKAGINCIIGSENYDGLEDLYKYGKEVGIDEFNFLRLKPSGKGLKVYDRMKTTYEQSIELIPRILHLSEKYDIGCKIDCSFMPFLCYHDPDQEMLTKMSIFGCEAANVIMGVTSDGYLAGCSFLQSHGVEAETVATSWQEDEKFSSLREFYKRAPEPCKSCSYLTLCKGGCRVVSVSHFGDIEHADPDCPKVIEYEREKAESSKP